MDQEGSSVPTSEFDAVVLASFSTEHQMSARTTDIAASRDTCGHHCFSSSERKTAASSV